MNVYICIYMPVSQVVSELLIFIFLCLWGWVCFINSLSIYREPPMYEVHVYVCVWGVSMLIYICGKCT